MSEQQDRPRTAWGVHLALYVLLAIVFIYTVTERYRRPFTIGDQAPVDPARLAAVQTRIDPNTAGWAELARLPDVGESLAREIVYYREAARAERKSRLQASPGTPADDIIFRSLQDLDPIPGIGEKTLARIASYLVFPSPE